MIGGRDLAGDDEAVKELKLRPGHTTFVIEVPIYQKQFRTFDGSIMRLQLKRGPDTLLPRFRHATATDGKRYVYVMGSTT